MALALYRRYRPDTFDGVIGQDQVVVPLSRALDEGKLTHAYLFSGPRGCGKTSSARILARCINCEKGPTSHPCGKCESCRDLSANGAGSIDVVEIDAASHNGVDDARELRERAGFAPARDRYKIFILDEAHMVTQQGFNALLKIVEEPPEHVMFIFATTEPEKVIGTIRSRTHHYPFRLVPSEIMGPYLEKVCAQEKITPAPGVLRLAMRAGGGSVRDTLSVLDQLMVGSVDGTITYDSASALLGFTPEALISDAIDAVIDKDGSSLYSTIEKVVVGGFEPRRFVEDLLARVRDLLVLTLAGKQAVQVFSDETEGENTDSLARQAKALGLNKLTLIAQKINDTLATMSGATSPRMRLELLAAQLLAAVEEPVWQGQNLGQGQSSAAPQQTAVQNAPAAAPARGGFNPPPRKPAAAAQKAAPQQTEIRQAAPNTESAPRVENSVQTAEHSAQHTAEQTEQKVEHATAQEGVPASDMDLWKTTLAQMPHDLSAYVENSKVPIVEFSTNALGGKHLVFTFDTPLSQHAFALAVTNQNRSVPGLVQNEVRKVFGKTASIAPNTVAANGEAVQTVNSMSPQQRAEVKRSIALSAMKSATTTMQTPAEEHREAKTDSATSDGGDGDSDAHHVASVASAPAESISAAGVAPADVSAADDPWADDEAAPQQQVPQQAEQHEAKATKHVAVPQAGDEEDPWAQPEPAPESEPEREPEQESSTSSEPLSVTPSATMPQASAPRQTLNPMQGGAQQTMSPGGLRQQGQGDQSDRTPKPSVSAEEDTYSMNDESLGASDLVDLETLKKILDVKEVREIAPSDSDK